MGSLEEQLFEATETGDVKCAESLLVEHHVDVDVREPECRRTALMGAASFRQKAVVELLLSRNASLHCKDRLMCTAGASCACCSRVSVARSRDPVRGASPSPLRHV